MNQTMNLQTIMEVLKMYYENFVTNLNLYDIAYALILAVCGLSITILAKRITRVFKKRNDIDDEDKFMLTLKAFGLLLIFAALLMVIFQSI